MALINYAHRGCSEYYPENTLFSFYMGLTMKADGIETDIQKTKDGVLVLFHDDNLKRILGKEGSIKDYTYDELLQFDFGAFKGPQFQHETIVTLDEFCRHFGGKDLTFALELKQLGVEQGALEIVNKYQMRDRVIFTSFILDSIIKMRELDPDIRIGYLTDVVDDKTFEDITKYKFQQICPHIDRFTDEQFAKARAMGLSIRYWGIKSEDRMWKAINIGSDGMTINDPGMLSKALGR